MAVQIYVKQNNPYTATLNLGFDPDGQDVYLTMSHEWGRVVVDNAQASRSSMGVYYYDFTIEELCCYGKHKITWSFDHNGVAAERNTHFNMYSPYITENEFFDMYPELEIFSDTFDAVERRVRTTIDTICGQNFQYIEDQTLTYEGEGYKDLSLGYRCANLISVTQKEDVDISYEVELSPESPRYIRRKEQLIPVATAHQQYVQPKFEKNVFYIIRGDWGWEYVPINITDAAALLINDIMSSETAQTRRGISQIKMDQYSVHYTDSIVMGTGNVEADVLLMDYTIYTMGLI